MSPDAVPRDIALDSLKMGFSPRLELLDEEHARTLAEADADLPPIVVQSTTLRVIDGGHRVLAAKMSGRKSIPAILFGGDDEEAFVEAVRRNISHGKPLSMKEREHAAVRLLASHPDWSDRRLADICGLSPKTLARYRQCSTADSPQLESREGRDGKRRPVDPAQRRAVIAEHLTEHPDASLRSVAKSAGSSQSTVLDVRQRLERGESPLPGQLVERTRQEDWRNDAALRSTSEGSEFARWFQQSAICDEQWEPYVDVLPMSRIYQLIDDARQRVKDWARFADAMEGRVRGAPGPGRKPSADRTS